MLAVIFALGLSSVSQIELRAGWMALSGDPQQYVAKIARSGEGFVADATYRHGMPLDRDGTPQGSTSTSTAAVPIDRVERLLAALDDAPGPAPIAADFGMNQVWLNANASSAFASYVRDAGAESRGFYTPAQRSLYLSSFKNPAVASASLKQYYQRSPEPTDEGIYVSVRIALADRGEVTLESQSRRQMMLPWSVTRDGRSYATFNPKLSEAIAAFLPNDLETSSRLELPPLLKAMPDLVATQIKAQYDRLPPYDLTPTIRALERKYDVSISHSVWGRGSTKPAWPADLKWTGFPSNLSAVVALPIVDNSLGRTAAIPAARNFAWTLYGIPWVREAANRTGVSLRIELEEPESLAPSERQQSDFLADLNAIGLAERAEQLRPELSKSFIVMIDEPNNFSEWIVLPDRTMVLWHYFDAHPTKSILDLEARVLHGKPCETDKALLCSGFTRNPWVMEVPR